MKRFLQLLACHGVLYSVAALAQVESYFGPPQITVGVARPAGIIGYNSSAAGINIIPTVPEAVSGIAYQHLHGTCGGNNGGYSNPADCYVESVTWIQDGWYVLMHSRIHPSNSFYGWIYPVYSAGATRYIGEPPGAKDYYDGPTKHTFDPAKSLGPQACDECFGNPIYAPTGNKFLEDHDIDGPWNLRFTRYYNSLAVAPTHLLGARWTTNFSQSVAYDASAATAVVRRPGGSVLRFQLQGGQWVSDADISSRLTRIDDTQGVLIGWAFRPGDGREVEQFDARGRLMEIAHSDGESATLHYNLDVLENNANDYQLTSVVAQDGRELRMSYSNGRLIRVSNSGVPLVDYSYDGSGRLAYVNYAGGTRKTYLYGELAHTGGASLPFALTGVIDESQVRTATYDYLASGRAVATTLVGGVSPYTLSYGSDGSTQITEPLGGMQRREYVASSMVKRVSAIRRTVDGVTRSATRTYDAAGRLDVATDYGGTSTDWNFNDRGLADQVIESANRPSSLRIIQTDWHPNFNVPVERRVLSSSGELVAKQAWSYNGRGQVLSTTQIDTLTQELSRTTTFTYCEAVSGNLPANCPIVGLLASTDGPRTDVDDVTSFEYYDSSDCTVPGGACLHRRGDLWRVSNALGQSSEILAYDIAGHPSQIKDTNGIVTDLEYNQRGWLQKQKVRGTDGASESDDAVTTFEYWPAGELKKITLPDGAFSQFAYDPARRLTDITDALGNSVHYTLDSAGNRAAEDFKDSNGSVRHSLSRVYNSLGQLAILADADSTPTGFTYDIAGSLDTSIDRLGRVTNNTTDPLGRLLKTIVNAGGTASEKAASEFEYDALDRLTAVIDPKGLRTEYAYNAFGELIGIKSPDTQQSSYEYDRAGNRVRATDARGKSERYTYDALGRLTSQRLASPSQDIYFDYDYFWRDYVNGLPLTDCMASETFGVGRLAGVRDESGSTHYCYDRSGNIARKVQSVVGGSSLTVSPTFNSSGRMVAMSYPSGAIVTYLRNASGQISRIGVTPSTGQPQATLVSAVTYLPFGPLSSLTFGNGRVLTKSYDANYVIDRVSDSAAANSLSIDLGVDGVGRITSLSERTGPTAVVGRVYSYDGLDRLTWERNGSKTIEGFAYDAIGNRLSKVVGNKTSSYSYPATSHRLTAIGTMTRTYDASGNTTQIGIGSFAPGFVYDDRNRLREYKIGASVKASYRYNAKGEQVLRIDGTTPANSRQYVYDESGHLLGEYTTSGLRIQEYVWAGDTLVGILSDHDGSTYQYVETDHLGTPRAVVLPNAMNRIVWRWDLNETAFGDHPPQGDPDGNRVAYRLDLRYPGQRMDPVSGLFYNYFRDYDPATGRYLESDPIGLRGGLSTYNYAANDALRFSDASGLFISSVDAACMQDPSFCVELLGGLAQSQARVAQMTCDGQKAAYFTAVADGFQSLAKPAILAGVAVAVLVPALAYRQGSTAAVGRGYESFGAFKRSEGVAGPGLAWHHIVEQTPSNIERFGAEAIHNTLNLIRLPHGPGTIHNQISGYYSSKRLFAGGRRVRDWLSTQSFDDQLEFGLETMRRFGWSP